jgi:uncharacterized protein (DUF58 family)
MIGVQLLNTAIRRLRLERFFHGDGPHSEPLTLNRHRVFILPTRAGLMFGVVLVAMLIAATNYSNNMGFVFTFLLVGLGLMSMLHTYRTLLRLTFRAGHCAAVFVGESAQYTLYIDNPSPLPRFALTLSLDGGVPTHVDLPAQEVTRVVVSRPATQRGYVPMGRCTISSCFPVGLFCAWAYVDLAMQCLAYPAPARSQPLPPLYSSDHDCGQARGQGAEDFVGLRQYVPGDSPRHIAWKHAARDDTLLTKQFAGEGHVQRWLMWDDVASADVETRLSVLCRWVLISHADGVPYGLCLPGMELAPAWTPAHRQACLTALALYDGTRHSSGTS